MDPQAHEDRRRETEAAHPIVDESLDTGPDAGPRYAVGDQVLIGDYLRVVPDDADETIALTPTTAPATVVDVQDEATLIRFDSPGFASHEQADTLGDRIFAVMGDERARLRPIHGGSLERKAALDAKSLEGRVARAARDREEVAKAAVEKFIDCVKAEVPWTGLADLSQQQIERWTQRAVDHVATTSVEPISSADAVRLMDANIAADQARDREAATR